MGGSDVQRAQEFFARQERRLEEAVRRHFFLYYPTYRKAGKDGKGTYRSNAEDRADLVESIGSGAFLSRREEFGYLYDIPPPECLSWVYGAFMEIYHGSHDGVTFRDIAAWQDVRRARLSQYEADLVARMNGWAADEIARLKDGED